MAIDFRRFTKGILLKGVTADPSDNKPGSMWHNTTVNRLKSYIQSAIRVLVTEDQTQTLTNKTIDADANTISNIENADIKAAAAIDASKIADGSVSNTEFQFINSVTSNVQTQLDTISTAASTAQTTIDNHIADAIDAHDASAISNTPSGNLSATDVQGALNELQTQVDGLTGTVTQVNTGTGLTGGPITTTGTIELADTAVTPGSYTNADITVDAQGRITAAANGSGGSGANVTLSNLTAPTDINTDLTFDNGANRTLTVETRSGATGRTLTIQGGGVTGTNIGGGGLILSSGSSTGDLAGGGVVIKAAASGQGSGSTVRTPQNILTMNATNGSNTYLFDAPVAGGSGVLLTSATTTGTIAGGDPNSGSTAPSLNITSATNTGSGAGGNLNLRSGTKTVTSGSTGAVTVASGNIPAASSGTSGALSLETGSNNTTGASGAAQLITGDTLGGASGNITIQTGTGATRGSISLNAPITQTSTLLKVGTYFQLAVENQASSLSSPQNALGPASSVLVLNQTAALTINGIAAGVDGQMLHIIHTTSSGNLTLSNESGSATAANRIVTSTGADVVSTGASTHTLIYIAGTKNRWYLLGGQL